MRKQKEPRGFLDESSAGFVVGQTGGGRLVARCGEDRPPRHTVADANVRLNGVERPLVDHGSNHNLKRRIAMLRALRPMARPSFVARYRVDDPNRLAAMIGGVALFERWRLDHDFAGLGVKRGRYIVGRAYLLGADALLFDQPDQRRRSQAQDSGAGSADFAAMSGPALGVANSALSASECTCVSPGASARWFANGRMAGSMALVPPFLPFDFNRPD